ncbi:MAG: NUDIX hydrolase [Frankiaceae bacterium]
MPGRPRLIPCVGAVIRGAQGRFLLVQRANEPDRGLWSLPGGRVEPGESDAQALHREVAEEVRLQVRVGTLAGEVRRAGPAGTLFVIRDYLCTVTAGEPIAGSDAMDARFAAPGDVPVTPGLWAALAEWDLL